ALEHFVLAVRPHAGEAIGLQLHLHLDVVRRRLAVGRTLRLLCLRQNAQQILHVMADLVRDHVGLRKLARPAADVAAANTRRDLIKERGVEVDLLIGRAVERSHGALRGAAATGVRRAAIENQHWCAIDLSVLGEDLLPLQFSAAEHLAHEAAHVVLRRAGAARRRRRLHLRPAGTSQDLGAPDEQARVDAERPAHAHPAAPPWRSRGPRPTPPPRTPAPPSPPRLTPPPPTGSPNPPPPPPKPPSSRRSSTLPLSGRSSKRMASPPWPRPVTRPPQRLLFGYHRADQRACANIVAKHFFPKSRARP